MDPQTVYWGISTPIGLIIAAIGVALSYFLLREKRLNLPPSPPGWPVIGHLLQIGKFPPQSLLDLSRTYGPVMLMRLGYTRVLVLSRPEAIKEVLKTQDNIFASRPRNSMGEITSYNYDGLFWHAYDEKMKFYRRLLHEGLFNSNRMNHYRTMRDKVILQTIQQVLDHGRDGKPVRMDVLLLQASSNVITQMLFSKSYYGQKIDPSLAGEAQEFTEIYEIWIEMANAFAVGDFFPWLKRLDLGGWRKRFFKQRKRFTAYVDRIIEEHRQKKEDERTHDFLDLLLQVQNDKIDGLTLRDDQIRAVIQDLILAGSETTPRQIEWVLSELMRHPDVLQKVVAELDSVVGKYNLVEEEDLTQLQYLYAVICETFRLHPVAAILVPHMNSVATKVAGYDIPKDTNVFVNIYAVGRDPNMWENPLKFNPERFLGKDIDIKGNDLRITPFGSGRRICPGLPLGLVQLQMVLAQLLHTCELSLPAGMKPEDMDMTECLTIAAGKAKPLELCVAPRPTIQIPRVFVDV